MGSEGRREAWSPSRGTGTYIDRCMLLDSYLFDIFVPRHVLPYVFHATLHAEARLSCPGESRADLAVC